MTACPSKLLNPHVWSKSIAVRLPPLLLDGTDGSAHAAPDCTQVLMVYFLPVDTLSLASNWRGMTMESLCTFHRTVVDYYSCENR